MVLRKTLAKIFALLLLAAVPARAQDIAMDGLIAMAKNNGTLEFDIGGGPAQAAYDALLAKQYPDPKDFTMNRKLVPGLFCYDSPDDELRLTGCRFHVSPKGVVGALPRQSTEGLLRFTVKGNYAQAISQLLLGESQPLGAEGKLFRKAANGVEVTEDRKEGSFEAAFLLDPAVGLVN